MSDPKLSVAQARAIVIAYNDWRRGEHESWDAVSKALADMGLPNSARMIGAALDVLVQATEGME